jgi:hypothetical protein
MVQAFAALEAAYEKAAAANGGAWPDREQVVDAMEGLEFQGYGRPILIREDNQGLEAQLIGVSRTVGEYAFTIIDDMMIFDAADIMAPRGRTRSSGSVPRCRLPSTPGGRVQARRVAAPVPGSAAALAALPGRSHRSGGQEAHLSSYLSFSRSSTASPMAR